MKKKIFLTLLSLVRLRICFELDLEICVFHILINVKGVITYNNNNNDDKMSDRISK
jgi:hypothetical protein